MATLDKLRAAVAARTGTDIVNYATIMLDAINDAYREIVGRFDLNPAEAVVTLTGGTDTYDFNTLLVAGGGQADFNGLIELYGTDTQSNPFGLEQGDISHIYKLRAAALSTGQPTDYALTGVSGLEIYPIPTSGWTITMIYNRWRSTSNLAAGGDTPSLIPDPYHDLLELRAAVLLANRYESMGMNVNLGDRVLQQYQVRLGEFQGIMRERQGKQVRRLHTGYRRFARIRPAVPSQDLGGRY